MIDGRWTFILSLRRSLNRVVRIHITTKMDSESYICMVFRAYGHSHNRSNQRKRGHQLGSRRHGKGLSGGSWEELEKRKGKGCNSVSKNKNKSFIFKKFYKKQFCSPILVFICHNLLRNSSRMFFSSLPFSVWQTLLHHSKEWFFIDSLKTQSVVNSYINKTLLAFESNRSKYNDRKEILNISTVCS